MDIFRFGQLGLNDNITRLSPAQIQGFINTTDFVSVAAGSYHSFAISNDGLLWAFGDNQVFQLGDDFSSTKFTLFVDFL